MGIAMPDTQKPFKNNLLDRFVPNAIRLIVYP